MCPMGCGTMPIMSELSIQLTWQREENELLPEQYNNAHRITYNENHTLIGDRAPSWGGNIAYTNPEQALAAAVSSCQMMTFLALSAKAKWPVLSYEDHAIAYLGKNPDRKMAVIKLALQPKVTFDDGFAVDQDKLAVMHDRAHRYCFVANSLADYVEVVITDQTVF